MKEIKTTRIGRRVLISGTEAERQGMLSEAAQLMRRLALIMEQTRSMDQFLYRLRRKRCMKVVWLRRGRNENAVLSEMLRWLRQKAEKLALKKNSDYTGGDDEE